MTDTVTEFVAAADQADPLPEAATVEQKLIDQLVEQAHSKGLQLTGEGGLLQQLTKKVLESALEGEITDHLGYDKHDPAGKDGGNSRNGTRSKTVRTDIGPVEIDVPRDREGSFEPAIVKKRQRRLTGVDEMVLSLSAKGLTHGEISAHLAEVYGAEVSKTTIGTITDKVMDGRRNGRTGRLTALEFHRWLRTPRKEIVRMPRGGANRKPTAARRQYFELVRQGLKGAAAARQVGVSTSCGSKWFIEAGSMIIPDVSVSPRFLTQDDRIAIADGLRTGKPPTTIAAAIGKSTSTVYREIARGSSLYRPASWSACMRS